MIDAPLLQRPNPKTKKSPSGLTSGRAIIMKHPERPATYDILYTGIENLRPESKKVVEI